MNNDISRVIHGLTTITQALHRIADALELNNKRRHGRLGLDNVEGLLNDES